MAEPWTTPELSHTWSIHEIQDPLAFLSFVFDIAPRSSRWIICGAPQQVVDRLAPFALPRGQRPWFYLGFAQPPLVIPLPDDREAIRRTLATVPIELLIEQHVYAGGKAILVSYDNLSCCWLTQDVPRDTMGTVGARVGFRFAESAAAQQGDAPCS